MILHENAEVKLEANELDQFRLINKRSGRQIQFMIAGDDILLRTMDQITVDEQVIAIEELTGKGVPA